MLEKLRTLQSGSHCISPKNPPSGSLAAAVDDFGDLIYPIYPILGMIIVRKLGIRWNLYDPDLPSGFS